MISHKGDLALIGDRAGKSVLVVAIDGMSVKTIGEVPMENEVAAIAILPDGKRAFAAMNLANKMGVLAIDGQKVTYDKSLDHAALMSIGPGGKLTLVNKLPIGALPEGVALQSEQ